MRGESVNELLLIGELFATFPNGESATGESIARTVLYLPNFGESRIKSYEVEAVSIVFSFGACGVIMARTEY